jgi:hypothetical protein
LSEDSDENEETFGIKIAPSTSSRKALEDNMPGSRSNRSTAEGGNRKLLASDVKSKVSGG